MDSFEGGRSDSADVRREPQASHNHLQPAARSGSDAHEARSMALCLVTQYNADSGSSVTKLS